MKKERRKAFILRWNRGFTEEIGMRYELLAGWREMRRGGKFKMIVYGEWKWNMR